MASCRARGHSGLNSGGAVQSASYLMCRTRSTPVLACVALAVAGTTSRYRPGARRSFSTAAYR